MNFIGYLEIFCGEYKRINRPYYIVDITDKYIHFNMHEKNRMDTCGIFPGTSHNIRDLLQKTSHKNICIISNDKVARFELWNGQDIVNDTYFYHTEICGKTIWWPKSKIIHDVMIQSWMEVLVKGANTQIPLLS